MSIAEEVIDLLKHSSEPLTLNELSRLLCDNHNVNPSTDSAMFANHINNMIWNLQKNDIITVSSSKAGRRGGKAYLMNDKSKTVDSGELVRFTKFDGPSNPV